MASSCPGSQSMRTGTRHAVTSIASSSAARRERRLGAEPRRGERTGGAGPPQRLLASRALRAARRRARRRTRRRRPSPSTASTRRRLRPRHLLPALEQHRSLRSQRHGDEPAAVRRQVERLELVPVDDHEVAARRSTDAGSGTRRRRVQRRRGPSHASAAATTVSTRDLELAEHRIEPADVDVLRPQAGCSRPARRRSGSRRPVATTISATPGRGSA